MKKAPLDPVIASLKQSPTLKMNEYCGQQEAEGKKVYNLGIGQTPFPAPERLVEKLKEYSHYNSYLASQGLLELREAIAKCYSDLLSTDIDASRVIIGPGTKMLMYILRRCLEVEHIIPAPSWVTHVPQTNIAEKTYIPVQTKFENEWKITGEEISQAVKENDNGRLKMVLNNNPSNPTGRCFSDDERDQIVKACRATNSYVLSDKIYDLIRYDSNRYISVAHLYPEKTFITSGLSKSFGAGGWRIGFIIVPPEHEDLVTAMTNFMSETISAVTAPVQHAAIDCFENFDLYSDYLNQTRFTLQTISQYAEKRLAETDTRLHPSQGGFYLFPDLSNYQERLAKRGITTSDELCMKLLEDTKVAILPASNFGCPPEMLAVRLAYVNFDGAKVLQEGSLTEEKVKTHCADTFTAIDLIVDWLKNL